MKIKQVSGCAILDSRKEKTILVSIKTAKGGSFSASAPNGKSIGKHEAEPYRKTLSDDIKKLKQISDYFSKEEFVCFDCLKKIEDIADRQIGANTLFALESAVLKAIAKEKKKQVWQLIEPKADVKNLKMPLLVGNCIGGGMHTKIDEKSDKKPDFQEFLVISKEQAINKKAHELAQELLEKFDDDFKSKKNDENAWQTSLNDKIVLDIVYRLKEKFGVEMGIDVAASSFYKRKKYYYKNPKLDRDKQEQFDYIGNLIENFGLFYVEDVFEEDEFESFTKLLKKVPETLIVGDDLIATNYKRLEKAIKSKAINGIIIKPNQCGSLLEVQKVCKLARDNNIKLVFSHRSGETDETILADLAFGFQADFFKCGIIGKEREAKIKRLVDISRRS